MRAREFLMSSVAALVLAVSTNGAVVVNEAMVNEPGGATALEWFELYVDSNQPEEMGVYRVIVAEDTIRFPRGMQLPPRAYLVVCRKLVSSTGASFEGHWGDSSGVWGDTPDEAAIEWIVEGQFALVNAGGVIELRDALDLVSTLNWSDPGADGVSWERIDASSGTPAPSVDPNGSTPGDVNSITPVGYDLSIDDVKASVDNGLTTLAFTVANRGMVSHQPCLLTVYTDDFPTDPPVDLILELELPPLLPGESVDVEGERSFYGMYVPLVALLPDDDRVRNNRRFFTAPGEKFPAFVMTEMLPQPSGGSEGEWIEIVNRHYALQELKDWRVGDYGREELITDTSILVEPAQRIVLARSMESFAADYPEFTGLLIEPPSWSVLNDDADTIALIDKYSLIADRFVYETVFEDNHTWCRGEDKNHANVWGPSAESGGSPGEVNSVVFGDADAKARIDVNPEVFSPDGDGYQDSVAITIDGPAGIPFKLKVYDRQGRVVRHLDEGTYRLSSYSWDGRSDSGTRLPVGIYILYCEIDGAGSAKRPIVIAR